jgi:DNA-directed RNA polymerase subunit RPC12/RpoP
MAGFRKVNLRDRLITAVVIVVAVALIVIGIRSMARFGAVAVLPIPVLVLFLLVRWHAQQFGYCCGQCGAEFKISTFKDFISPHALTLKYLRCPQCGKRSWAQGRAKVHARADC